jgi:photosystem II stability/assembly factor-like uncharacterized protein
MRVIIVVILLIPLNLIFGQNIWQPTNGPFTSGGYASNVFSLCADSIGNIFVGTGGWIGSGEIAEIFKSTNNGKEWIKLYSNSSCSAFSSIAINNSGRIFAGSWSGGMYISSNGGTSWTQSNGGLTVLSINCVSSDQIGIVYVVTSSGIFRSLDNGQHWNPVNQGLSSLNARVSAIAPSGIVYVGTDEGTIFASTDQGLHWQSRSNGLKIRQVLSMIVNSQGHIYADQDGWGVYKSTDQGNHWISVAPDLYGPMFAMTINSLDYVFSGASNGPFRTIDGGQNWTLFNSGLSSWPVNALIVKSDGILFAGTGTGTYNGGVYRTLYSTTLSRPNIVLSSYSLSFGKIMLGQYKQLAVAIENEGTDTLRISNSTSNNSNFSVWPSSLVISPGQQRNDTVQFTPSTLGDFTGRILINNNASLSPETLYVDGIGCNTSIVHLTNTFVYFGRVMLDQFKDTSVTISNIGTDTLKINNIVSSDLEFTTRPMIINVASGQSSTITIRFTPFSIGEKYAVITILSNAASSPDTIIVFGDTGPITKVNERGELPKRFALDQNYPNPFNLSTIISFAIPSEAFVKLIVFDVVGREVAILENEDLPAGTYTRKWDAADVTSGIYFYRLQAGSFIETRKLLLLK